MTSIVKTKPRQGLFGLWNTAFGFFGIQVGFALQTANVTRIFQSLGTSIDALPLLWIAAPITGLVVQPLVGYFSDRTWGRLGRRRPYFLAGALLATIALLGLPEAPDVAVAALLLWLLDGSLNITMEPFRAFVGDMLPPGQRTTGYAVQTGFIGVGAVAASLAPMILSHRFGVSNVAAHGEVAPSVRIAFQIGAGALFVAVLWTVLTTREYAPEQLAAFGERDVEDAGGDDPLVAPRAGPLWLALGLVGAAAVAALHLDKGLYILAGAAAAFGLIQIIQRRAFLIGRGDSVMGRIISDLMLMPKAMRGLALVQFFTWCALFILWVFATPVVAEVAYGTTDAASIAYADGADWVGALFAVYNGVAAIAASALPPLAARVGRKATHIACLLAGSVGFALIPLIRIPVMLLAPMLLIGLAWASLLTMPYAILAGALPQRKLGTYMGLFNIFIVLPQFLVSSLTGAIGRTFFGGDPRWTLFFGAIALVAAAAAMTRVDTHPDLESMS